VTTETQVVKRIVAALEKNPRRYSGYSSRALRWDIYRQLERGDVRSGGCHFGSGPRPDRAFMVARLEKLIRKKAAQPFRRKRRGPMRAKAAGKNEVRARSR